MHSPNAYNSLLANTEAGNLELSPGLPSGWQGPNDLSHHWRLPEFALAGSWNRKMEAELKSRHSKTECECLNVYSMTLSQMPSIVQFGTSQLTEVRLYSLPFYYHFAYLKKEFGMYWPVLSNE